MYVRKMLTCLILVFCIVGVCNFVYAGQANAFTVNLKITNDFGTETTEFNVGDTINIDVNLNETSGSEYLMYAAQFEVIFDNSYADLINVTPKASEVMTGTRSNKAIFAYLSPDNKGITRPSELLVGSVQLKATKDAVLNISCENVKVTNQDASLRTVEVDTAKTVKIGSGIALVDRKTLKAKIDVANDTKSNIFVSSDGYNVLKPGKWVTQNEFDALDSAISSAVSAYNNATITQEELASSESTLDNAITAFKNAIKIGRKSSGGATGGSSSGGSASGGGSGGVTTIQNTVTFEANGGSSVSSVTVNNNSKVFQLSKPQKDGFVFDGWYTDASLTNRFDVTKPITKNVTLYAKWIVEPEKSNEDFKPDEWENPFSDVKADDWYYAHVSYAFGNGLMKGATASEFAPNADITRAMFVTVLYRMEKEPQAGTSSFSDVESGSYYEKAVNWCSANEIVNGATETEFAPNKSITREQMATIVYRYAKFKGFDLNTEDSISYIDSASISDYAKNAVIWAKNMGIMSGNADNTFAPNSNSTRAQAAAVFRRIIENLK